MKFRSGLVFLLVLALTGCSSATEEKITPTPPTSEEPEQASEQAIRLYIAGEYDERQVFVIGWWRSDGSKDGNFRILQDGELLAELTGAECWNEEDMMFEYMQDFIPEQETYLFTVEDGTYSAELSLRKENGVYQFEDKDSDNDGLPDIEELWLGTDPENPDTDGDGLPDGYEAYGNGSDLDPLLSDTDGNGIPDGEEDFDADGLNELEEYQYGTNHYAYDTDGDGFSDGYEVQNSMNPLEYDEITVDRSVIEGLVDYSVEDIVLMNQDEYYPLEIDYNDDTTQVTSIMGVYSEVAVLTPTDAIYALYNVKSLLGLDAPEQELRIARVNDDRRTGNVYCFAQYYNGLKVRGRTVNVSVDTEGKTLHLSSSALRTESFREMNLTPDITEDKLTEIVSAETDTEYFTSELVIDTKSEETPILVYQIDVNFGSMTVDAHSGEILTPWHSSLID